MIPSVLFENHPLVPTDNYVQDRPKEATSYYQKQELSQSNANTRTDETHTHNR